MATPVDPVSPSPETTFAAYHTVLRGRAAATWLTMHGLDTKPDTTFGARFDTVVTDDFGTMRAMHSTSSMNVAAGIYDHGVAVYMIEGGTLTVDTGDRSYLTRSGEVFLAPTSTPITKSTRGDIRRLSWTFSPQTLGLPRPPKDPVVLPAMAHQHLKLATVHLTHALLESRSAAASARFRALRQALESTASLWLGAALSTVLGGSGPDASERIRQRARAEVSNGYRDASFSVSALSSQLGISERHLRRAFQDEQTAPSDLIRNERVFGVLRDIEVWGTSADLTWIARNNGFNSVRTMRAALSRFEAERAARR